ncbi:MAG: acyltransferase [Coriobacteriales bacterium]|jgi:peptidoglycan/LPS O-acetylase OafA/YrhL|nr:acyltransferase [Coriobacteriales bacterium]
MNQTTLTPSRNPEPADGISSYAWLSLLRAFGLVLVLLYHFFPTWLPGGFIGVDVFFVFSGYLITSLLLREYEQNNRVRLLAFYERRVRRLLPAMAFMLICTLPLAMLISPDFRAGILQQVAAALGWVSNYYEIATGGSYANALLPQLFVHTWTLAVEMQYYLFWGWALFVLVWQMSRLGQKPKHGLVATSMAAIAGVLALASWGFMQYLVVGELETLTTTTTLDPSRAYFDTLSHGYPLLIGSALGAVAGFKPTRLVRLAQRIPARVSLLLVAALLLGVVVLALLLPYQDSRVYHFGILLTALASAGVLLLGRSAQQQLQARPEPWLPKYLADRSYSIYLFHWPLVIIAQALAEQLAPLQGTALNVLVAVLFKLLALALTLALAHISFRFVEQPFRKHSAVATADNDKENRPPCHPAPLAKPAERTAEFASKPARSKRPSIVRRATPTRRYGNEYTPARALGAGFIALVLLGASSLSIYASPAKTSMQVDYERQAQRLDLARAESAQGKLAENSANVVVGLGSEGDLPYKPSLRDAMEGGYASEEQRAEALVDMQERMLESHGDVNPVTIIGDSVTLGAAEQLQAETGAYIDAEVSRNVYSGGALIAEMQASGNLGEYVVIALATNIIPDAATGLDNILAGIEPGHRVILVTSHGVPEMSYLNDYIRTLPQQYPWVTVADWDKAISGHEDLLAPDGYHAWSDEGRQIYADTVTDAIFSASLKPTS